MNYTESLEHLQKLKNQSENMGFRKKMESMLSLLSEIQDKNIPKEEKINLQNRVRRQLENIQTEQQATKVFKLLRVTLTKEFGFFPPNYFAILGMGIGLAIGTALGISFGTLFNSGIVYGPVIGSGIGLIGGLVFGRILDMRKEEESRILKNL